MQQQHQQGRPLDGAQVARLPCIRGGVLLGLSRAPARARMASRRASGGVGAASVGAASGAGAGATGAVPTHERLYAAARADPLHDLSLDFERTYLTHRCGQSVPLLWSEQEGQEDDGAFGGGGGGGGDRHQDADARLDHCLTVQRAYDGALRQLTHPGGSDAPAAASGAALGAAVLAAAFVLGDGDGPEALLLEADAAIGALAERALRVARGDNSPRGLAAAVSEALFGQGDDDGGGLHPPSSSAPAQQAAASSSGCFYDPSNSCVLTVLRRIVSSSRSREKDRVRTGRSSSGGSSSGNGSRSRARSAEPQPQQRHRGGSAGASAAAASAAPLGSPAALALVWSLVATRAGLVCAPLTLPSHTFVQLWQPTAAAAGRGPRDRSPPELLPWVVDPYNAGQVCTASVVRARLSRNWGVPLDGGGAGDGRDGGSSGSSSGGNGSGGAEGPSSAVAAAAARPDAMFALALVRLLCNLRESSWAPLPLTGRVRWAPARAGGGDGGGGGDSGGGGGGGGAVSVSSSRSNGSSSGSNPRSRRTWPPWSAPVAGGGGGAMMHPLPSQHEAAAARLAVRARRGAGWSGGGGGGGSGGGGGGTGNDAPGPPPLPLLAARCVRSLRLLRATLRELATATVAAAGSGLAPAPGAAAAAAGVAAAALARLDRDEGYALHCGGMHAAGRRSLGAYLAQMPDAPDAPAVREFLL